MEYGKKTENNGKCTDLMMNCRKVERKGTKVVLITDEFPGKDGKSQSLADTCDEATALASCGQGNMTLMSSRSKILYFGLRLLISEFSRISASCSLSVKSV